MGVDVDVGVGVGVHIFVLRQISYFYSPLLATTSHLVSPPLSLSSFRTPPHIDNSYIATASYDRTIKLWAPE